MCGDTLPFQMFPGIFSSIDSYSKKVTLSHYRQHGRVPAWFEGFGELGVPISIPGWSRFQVHDPETNVLLTGVPDEILRHPKHGLWIGDYKTARFTETQDELAPMYAAQLNCYGLIAARIGLGSVYGLGLLYYEPVTDVMDADRDLLVKNDCFLLKFSPKIKPVKLDPNLIPPLLRRAREICELSERPPRRPSCRDCCIMDTMVQGLVGAAVFLKNDLIRSLGFEHNKRDFRGAKRRTELAYDI